jgi:sulfur-oxidizing protein SoxY
MAWLKITRREAIVGTFASAGAAAFPAQANTPNQIETAIRRVLGEAKIQKGKVTLDLPPLVENGNTVPMSISVQNPMTKDNYVKAIHVFNEKNPQANVISVALGPRAGKAEISTRIRLAGTQKIMAVAQLSDGSCWSDTADVVVTLAACLEDISP